MTSASGKAAASSVAGAGVGPGVELAQQDAHGDLQLREALAGPLRVVGAVVEPAGRRDVALRPVGRGVRSGAVVPAAVEQRLALQLLLRPSARRPREPFVRRRTTARRRGARATPPTRRRRCRSPARAYPGVTRISRETRSGRRSASRMATFAPAECASTSQDAMRRWSTSVATSAAMRSARWLSASDSGCEAPVPRRSGTTSLRSSREAREAESPEVRRVARRSARHDEDGQARHPAPGRPARPGRTTGRSAPRGRSQRRRPPRPVAAVAGGAARTRR